LRESSTVAAMDSFFSATQTAGENLLPCDPFPSAAAMLNLDDESKGGSRPAKKKKSAPRTKASAPPAISEKTALLPAKEKDHINPSWGRFNGGTWLGALGCGAIIVCCPILVILLQMALFHFHGSLLSVASALWELGPIEFTLRYAPRYSATATAGYAAWVLFQGFLYMCLPSKICYGQQTPAGHLLPYHINGLSAWIVTHVLYAASSYAGILDPAIIARNWEGLIVAFNMYGYLLPLIAYVKAHLAPTHTDDRKFSGSMIYDYYMGIEFNPRIGAWFDFKLFHNGRPGIVMWTLM
jgi:7-dehydrocholesterol reductase